MEEEIQLTDNLLMSYSYQHKIEAGPKPSEDPYQRQSCLEVTRMRNKVK